MSRMLMFGLEGIGEIRSGDVLAGIAGALLAAGVDTLRAGALAAGLQAAAASALPGPRTPDELIALGGFLGLCEQAVTTGEL